MRALILLLFCAGSVPSLPAQSVSRREAVQIAESFVQHHWQASPKNRRHGQDSRGIEVHTPDREGGRGMPLVDCWTVGLDNVGVAYKWGGLDTPESFDAGIKSGKAAGDVYTPEKRRLDQAAIMMRPWASIAPVSSADAGS